MVTDAYMLGEDGILSVPARIEFVPTISHQIFRAVVSPDPIDNWALPARSGELTSTRDKIT